MDGREAADHYRGPDYDTKSRFISYWHQAHELLALKPENVLEIGMGNGFLSGYLRKWGQSITTLDVDPDLKPDVTGSVLKLPFADGTFDVVACFEVLEHLPYEDFSKALSEIWRVSRRGAVLSVPDHSAVYRVDIELPLFGEIRKLVPHPFPRAVPHVFDGVHYWVIGKAEYPLSRIGTDIRAAGFEVSKTYRVFEFYGHRFFVLKKPVS